MLSVLYGVSISAINQHIKKIYEDKELEEKSTIKNFLIVQDEENRKISRNVIHYNLQMIIAVGFKVDNERAIQFRKWANQIVKDFTIKGCSYCKKLFIRNRNWTIRENGICIFGFG